MYAFRLNFTKVWYQKSNQQYSNIGSDNGLASNGRQAFVWTNDRLVYWRIYASLGPKGFN